MARRARSRLGAGASAIAQVLGIKSQDGRPALGTLLDALSSQNVLIVFDNCEHLIDDCAKVADAILRRCPRVHLMTASREPLGIGEETIYRVPSLSLPGPDEDDASGLGHQMRWLFSRIGRGRRRSTSCSTRKRARS